MRRVDVFNGDADGICALRQLRLAEPAEAQPVTGLKHDIELLERVDAGPGDEVTVVDLSLARNREALERLLARGVRVRYFDHHEAGPIPRHANLEATIDPGGLACTSELVDRALAGAHRAWAVVGAFGDGFSGAAERLARSLELDAHELQVLRELGEAMNYNAYADTESDAILPPREVYRVASRYRDPLAMAREEPVFAHMARQREADLEGASLAAPIRRGATFAIHRLPEGPASRRVLGAFANARALDDPGRAHAIIAPRPDGHFAVSVRCPVGSSVRASELCARFPTGGGRATAAAIGRLESGRLDEFLRAFEAAYGDRPP